MECAIANHGHSISSRTGTIQPGEPLGALVDSGLNAAGIVQVSRLLPQSYRGLRLSSFLCKHCEGTDRVRDIQWGRVWVGSIGIQRLTIALLGVLYTRRVVIQLSKMPNRVSKQQTITNFAANVDRFLVQTQRPVAAPEVSLDLAERP